MARRAWIRRTLAALAVAAPLAVAAADPASAGHRHGGWYGSSWYGGGHHWRHGHHRHWRGRHHRHHGSGISGLFIFDLTPRPAYVAPPPPVIVQPPPVVYQTPPPVVYRAPPSASAYCREYTTTVLVNGQPVQTYGTACMQADGSWRIVSMN